MNVIRRYQAACIVLAGAAVLATVAPWRGHPAPGSADDRGGAAGQAARRQLRLGGGGERAEQDLLARLRTARSLAELAQVCDRLVMIGTDRAVPALGGLVGDPRGGVPELVIATLGKLGTPAAVERLVELVDDHRPRVRSAAVAAIGLAGGDDALAVLDALANDRGDPDQATAVQALGLLGTDGAADALTGLATTMDLGTATAAITALGQLGTAHAQAKLETLLALDDTRLRVVAIAALAPTTPEVQATLVALTATGDGDTVTAAVTALGHSGEPALASRSPGSRPTVQWRPGPPRCARSASWAARWRCARWPRWSRRPTWPSPASRPGSWPTATTPPRARPCWSRPGAALARPPR
ncbi:MAG: HEAT repeat domain-containing protein [Kofleriaceae bacterium]